MGRVGVRGRQKRHRRFLPFTLTLSVSRSLIKAKRFAWKTILL
jgi:hypothetical protein